MLVGSNIHCSKKLGNFSYNNHFKLQAAKITIDGSPQGKTALVSHPYHGGGPAGQKDWKGESSITQEQLDAITKKLFDAKIPLHVHVHVHANGDGAIDMMIKTIEHAGISAKDDRRTVIVHSQFQRPEHLPKYVELGLTPSYFRCQPWRAKRRLVDPSSREAALFSRRALRQRENKVGLRTRRPVIGSQVRSSNELAKLLRSAG
ncbi:amidohydrolase family protein [Thiolapillus sp.]|uniref:amidohydrolase family protein n=1 Tax=Thiolapillus sp. TaxID=2017437 RepID=UPI003AF9BD78